MRRKHVKRGLFPQQDQLYTWAAVSQPTNSMEHLDGKLKGPWSPARPGRDHRTELKHIEAGKNHTHHMQTVAIVLVIWENTLRFVTEMS